MGNKGRIYGDISDDKIRIYSASYKKWLSIDELMTEEEKEEFIPLLYKGDYWLLINLLNRWEDNGTTG